MICAVDCTRNPIAITASHLGCFIKPGLPERLCDACCRDVRRFLAGTTAVSHPMVAFARH
jgi:hypothetical protein